MKPTLFYLLIISFCNTALAQNEQTLSLKEAMQQKRIVLSGTYNENSVHYLRPVAITIVSLLSTPFKLKIKSGDLFVPEDTACQTMMITGDTVLMVGAGTTKKITPFGMCIEPHDRAGKKGLAYRFKENKNPKLIEIAEFIFKNRFNDGVGQHAVWCVVNKDMNLLDINGYDSISRKRLISKVAGITGKKMPDDKELRLGYQNYTQPKITESIGGTFEFKFSDTTNVHIAMFNALGTIVRELYYNPREKPGVKKVEFEFDYTQYTDEFYTIKLIANQEVYLTSQIDRKDDNWIEVPER
jgi:hypothetical protein